MSIPKALQQSPLAFKSVATFNKARAGVLSLPHGEVRTPVYMPVGTKGAMKGLLPRDLRDLIDVEIMLCNTYHLFLTPGEEILKKFGGQHEFMKWDKNLLTDSGGFQMISLSELCNVDEEGVTFQSHIDKREFRLTPERSIEIQNCIGSDIMMQLDDVVQTTTVGPRVEEAMERSLRWLDRCIAANKNPERQSIFGILHGAVNREHRLKCCEEILKRDLRGYAIGGLVGGEAKEDFWQTVDLCTGILPDEKPRYVMGVGYPIDLVVCACLGADMFDCVFATRTARFGTAFTKHGWLKLKKQENEYNFGPIDEDCKCSTCARYSRSYLHMLYPYDETAMHLVSVHNVSYLLSLMRGVRQAIIDGNLPEYINVFLNDYFKFDKEGIPSWVVNAMAKAGIEVVQK